MVKRVGFIGLGFIGEPMARNLADGFELSVHDLRPEAVATLVEAGAAAASSAREVAERSEVVCVCVLDDAQTRSVVEGEDGILAGAAPGSVVVLHSTIHPDTARGLAERCAEKGVQLVDAPMTGGPTGAAERTLRFMVGGDDEAVARCRPVLEALSAELTHCGAVGLGAVAKLCNNLAQFQAWQGFVEADRLATNAGLSRETLQEVLSWIMNDNARVFMAGRSALEADPDNEFLKGRFEPVMLLAEKDLTLALEVARSVGVTMPGIGLLVQELARLFAVPDPKRR